MALLIDPMIKSFSIGLQGTPWLATFFSIPEVDGTPATPIPSSRSPAHVWNEDIVTVLQPDRSDRANRVCLNHGI